jgi:hypothetical protein
MSGTWTVTADAVSQIHTFTAPEEGWLVTSHVIELPSQLFVVDAQYTLPFAREVARYAAGLHKPLTRLYVTHTAPTISSARRHSMRRSSRSRASRTRSHRLATAWPAKSTKRSATIFPSPRVGRTPASPRVRKPSTVCA